MTAALIGFTADQILQYMMQQMPQLSPQIQRSLRAGFRPEVILKYMQGKKASLGDMKLSSKDIDPDADPLTYARLKQREQSPQEKQLARLAKFLGSAAVTGAIGYGAYSYLNRPVMPSAISGPYRSPNPSQAVRQQTQINVANPQIVAQGQPPQQLPFQPPQLGGPQQPPTAPATPQGPQTPISPAPASSEPIEQPQGDPLDALSKLISLDHAVNILRTNPSKPEAIEGIIRLINNRSNIRDIEKQYGKPINQIVSEAIPALQEQEATMPKQTIAPIAEEELQQMRENEKIRTAPKESVAPLKQTKVSPQSLQPGDLVNTKAGETGRLKSIHEKVALVDIGGKLRKVDTKDLSIADKGEGQYKQRDIVGTKDGRAGMIDSINGDKAYINISGKIHEMNLNDIETQPKWLKSVKVDMNKANIVEGTDLSSAVINGINYDPGSSMMYVDFRGSPYVFFDVPKKIFDNIKQGKWAAKTTGASGQGIWSVGEGNSIGATVFKELTNAGYDYEVLTPGVEKPFKRGEKVHIKGDGIGIVASAGKGQAEVRVDGEKVRIKNKNLEKI